MDDRAYSMALMSSNVFHYVKIVMVFVEKDLLSRNPLDSQDREQRLYKFK